MNPDDEAKLYLQYSTAVDANGESAPLLATVTFDPDSTQPRNLRNPGRSSSEAWLTWDAPSDSSGLRDYEITCPGRGTVQTTAREHIAGNLIPEVAYQFKVQPRRTAGMPPALSQSITVVTHDLTPPNKPKALRLTTLTPDSASLSWTASTSNGVRYRVYLNGSLVGEIDQLHFTLAHLQDHTDFHVKVRAVNTSGIMSSAASLRFNTLLRAPTNLRFSHLNGFCRLAWDPSFGKYPTHVVSINGKVFTTGRGRVGYNFKLADLSPGPAPHRFNFAVYARLDDSISKTTELERTLTDDVPPSKPGAPIVSDITDTSARLTWEPSSDNVGVTGYKVFLNSLPGLFFVPDAHHTLNRLTSGAYYYVFVRARDKDGNLSAPSGITVFKTTGQAPKPPPSAPKEVRITPLTSTSAKLEWSFVEEEAVTTGARIMINDEHYVDVLFMAAITLSKLIPDVEYSIKVRAFDYYGQLSEPATLVYEPKDVTPPSVPENLREIASTFDSVTLAWEESTDDVSMCGYVIYNNHEYFDSTPLAHYTAVGLFPGSYSFEVCALDAFGNASEPASIVVEIKS